MKPSEALRKHRIKVRHIVEAGWDSVAPLVGHLRNDWHPSPDVVCFTSKLPSAARPPVHDNVDSYLRVCRLAPPWTGN
jgi:hypothetical protein